MSALAVESWTWYAISWVVVLARTISRRILHGSFKKIQSDDILMLVAMATDTVLIACMNILARTNTNLIDPDNAPQLTDADIAERIYGSKLVLVVEQMQIITVWLIKVCLLIMYARLTMSLKQNLAVKVVAVYVAFGFVLMEILYMGVWCRPFTEYWAVPPNSTQCSAATNHLITNAVLNISSDLMIICIPMPVFLAAKLPTKRKAILVGVFALGIFTILSAILNKYYSFSQPFGNQWTFWYIRESSTAIITANLPFTWTLLQRTFNLRSFNGKSSGARTSEPASRFRSGYGRGTNHLTTISRGHPGIELGSCNSQEQINDTFGTQLKIYQQTEVHVSRQDAHPSEKGPETPSTIGSNLKAHYPGGASDEETSSNGSSAGVVTEISKV
ncbi:ubid family decarboxylase [Seiridium cupressi]